MKFIKHYFNENLDDAYDIIDTNEDAIKSIIGKGTESVDPISRIPAPVFLFKKNKDFNSTSNYRIVDELTKFINKNVPYTTIVGTTTLDEIENSTNLTNNKDTDDIISIEIIRT